MVRASARPKNSKQVHVSVRPATNIPYMIITAPYYYIKAFIRSFCKKGYAYMCRKRPHILVRKLRRAGIEIDDDVIFFDPETLHIDMSRPSLISIKGGGTFLHKNLTILTHDYATCAFLSRYGEFVPCSGRVSIGRNVWFGMNVTCLKGADIGDNCIIGYGSVVTGKIPPGSVAVGCPAKVVGSFDDYYRRRLRVSVDEAFEYARSIKERYGRRPVPADFWEEFPLFVSGDQVAQYPQIPIRRQMKNAYGRYVAQHKAMFATFDDFLKAAGIE